MKRFHVHVAVSNLQESVRFYSAMFGAEPAVVKPDYAKWMLDDPRLNFAISERRSPPELAPKRPQFPRTDLCHVIAPSQQAFFVAFHVGLVNRRKHKNRLLNHFEQARPHWSELPDRTFQHFP